jgi:single-strand DNA-binding protein
MASVNKAIIIGRLGADPEIRYTPGGQNVANFRIATNEVWNDRGGQRQKRTEWHRIVVWGKQADQCKEYLRKGRMVYVEGRIQTREWEDRDGNRRWTTEIVAQNIRFLDGSGAAAGDGASYGPPSDSGPGAPDMPEEPSARHRPAAEGAAPPSVPASETFEDDDIPF